MWFFLLSQAFNQIIKPKVKIMITIYIYLNYHNFFFYFFSLLCIRISGKNLNFGDKKNQKKWFLQKQKSNQDRWHWC